jgi:hypothetical protein
MVKTLGVVFIALLLSLPAILADFFTDSKFLFRFASDQSVPLMATVLALNVAIVTFLIGHLVTIESQLKKMIFKNTRNELKQNIYLMVVIFFLNFFIVAATKENLSWHFGNKNLDGTLILSSISAFLTILLILALVEIISVVVSIHGFINSSKKN